MFIRKNYFIPLVLISMIFVTSCKKEIYYEFEGINGSLVGDVYDSELHPLKGVLVELQGTDYSSITDENGRYTIENLTTNIYSFVFSKDGYGTNKVHGYQFIAGNLPTYYNGGIRMAKIPNYGIKEIMVDTMKMNFLQIYGKLDYKTITELDTNYIFSLPDETSFYLFFRYFISNKMDVSYNNYLNTGTFFKRISEKKLDSTIFLHSIYIPDLIEFEEKQKVYLVIHPFARDQYSGNYTDIITGCKVYTNLSQTSSNVAEFTFPVFNQNF